MLNKWFSRRSRVERIHEEINALIGILEGSQGRVFWVRELCSLLKISKETRLCYAVRAMYGGMGSFNDILFHELNSDAGTETELEEKNRLFSRHSSALYLLTEQRNKRSTKPIRLTKVANKDLGKSMQQYLKSGYVIHTVRCGDQDHMLRDFAEALEWKKHFGYCPQKLNLDALNDAFCNVPNRDKPRLVLVLEQFEECRKRNAAQAAALVEIFEDNMTEAKNHGFDLLVVDVQDRQVV
ncbi:MAG: barstar family protein [Shimia sp.]|uniref:barstar family protein n=1 Tax=Shimia sp. TaxID=1954381 RepID=UPI0040588265